MKTKQFLSMLLVMLMSATGAWADTPVIHRGVTLDHAYIHEHFGEEHYIPYSDWLAFDCVLVNDGVYDITTFYDMKLKETIDMYPQSVGELMNYAKYADYKVLNPQAASTDYFVMTDLQVQARGQGRFTYSFEGYFTGFYTKQEMAESLDAINDAATYQVSADDMTKCKNDILNAELEDARGRYDYYVEQMKYVKHIVYNPNASDIGSAVTDNIFISGSIKDCQFQRAGYTFTGWNTMADGSGTTYTPGDVINTDKDKCGELVLYAQWTANKYSVTFDKQNGTGGSANVTATYDAAMPAITLPTRESYYFKGYYSGQNGTGIKYYNADGTSAHVWNIAENTTLYAYWKQAIPYIDADGTEKYVGIYDDITEATTTLTAGWYAVSGDDVQTGSLVCEGEVHLILMDGAMLTATGNGQEAGINVSAEGASLTIYGQSEQTGQLIANGGQWGAGIGGGDGGEGHDITINGGKITATGNDGGAGIGGGFLSSGHDITINGGVVTAVGTGDAAGIGGGYYRSGHDITINGGVVSATGGNNAAGIGGGHLSSGHDITINGGMVTATGGNNGAGIGGRMSDGGHDIYVNSALSLYADNNNPPATLISHDINTDVAGELAGKQYTIVRTPVQGITVTLNKQGGEGGTDQVTVNESEEMPEITVPTLDGFYFQGYYSGENGTGIKYYNAGGTSAHVWNIAENTTLYAYWKQAMPYIDADGTEKCVGIYDDITESATTLTAGWYTVSGTNVKTGSLVCEGEVHLILMDGAMLTATGNWKEAGINVSAEDASLTIYGQSKQTGQLIANGGQFCAGIGGGEYGAGHDITINGGKITATGNLGGTGIGGGYNGEGYNITINAGVVTAVGNHYAAGIGGGYNRSGHDITINDGVIKATGGDDAPGIGGISGADNIHINAALILKADNNEEPTTEIEFTSTEDMVSKLNDKKCASLALPSVTLNNAPEMEANFSTFYHKNASYNVPNEDATIYTASIATLEGETCLVLRKIEGSVIPADTPVILSTEETTTINLQPCEDASGITVPKNNLSGASLPMEAPANCHILSYGQYGLGFYQYAVGKPLAAHKAYLIYAKPAGTNALSMVFEEDEETGVSNIFDNDTLGDDKIYSISGTRMSKLQRGVNIVNGKKVMVK